MRSKYAKSVENKRSFVSYSRYSASTIMNSYCKELTLMAYDIIGFDLDGTLLCYDLQQMTTLIYNSLKQFLVEHKGYPSRCCSKSWTWIFCRRVSSWMARVAMC